MQERDAAAAGAAPRCLVDEAVPRRTAGFERPVEIRQAGTEVVNAGSALGEKLRHRARLIARLEQLDLDVAQRQADDGGAVRRLGRTRLEAEHVPVESEGGVDRRNGDAD